MDFWYFLISLSATVPGLNLCGFFTPVVTGAVFLAIFCATSCFLGTFWAVDFLAVCLVLAIGCDELLNKMIFCFWGSLSIACLLIIMRQTNELKVAPIFPPTIFLLG